MRRARRASRGFGLVESLVSLTILLVVMVGVLTMLDGANRISKQETGVADAQSSGRSGIAYVTRMLRQARVGQLSYGNAILPFAENAPVGTTLTDVDGVTHTLRPGTDAIEARAVFGGETHVFGPTDVTCGGPCTLSSPAVTVTIRQTSSSGYANYPAGGAPAIATKKTAFYYVVATATTQTITAGASTYVMPLYVMGRVDTSAGWYTQTATTFTFVMNASDSGARLLDATADTATLVQTPTTGGAVDDILFFVDRGSLDPKIAGLYAHPFLAQGTRDPATGRWNVAPIAPEVEDLQLAYGIDGADGSVPDGGVDPARLAIAANGDEWVYSVAGETLTVTPNPPRVDAFYDLTVPSAPPYPTIARPALRAVYVAIVVKSAEPDPTYAGPGAFGIKALDSTAPSVSAANSRPYRRRMQTMSISLRNYS